MKTKIVFFLIFILFFWGCNSTKRVPVGSYLLNNTEVLVNQKKDNSDAIQNILVQKENPKLFNMPLKLYLYNWAKPKSDSIFQAEIIKNPKKYNRWVKWLSAKQIEVYSESFWNKGIHDFLRKNGSEPVIFDEKKAKLTSKKLINYLDNIGFPKAKVSYKIDTIDSKKIKITYLIEKNIEYTLDTLKTEIASPQLDSLYKIIEKDSWLKRKEVYKVTYFEKERNRLTNYFRNNGVIDFQPTYVKYVRDSIGTGNKFNITTKINDLTERVQDTIFTRPFEIYKIREINVFTDSPNNKVSKTLQDSISYQNINIYSKDPLKYKPKVIANAVFLEKNQLYSDYYKNLTSKAIYNLDEFNNMSIQYVKDSTKTNGLIANIYMTQKPKFQFINSIDFTHSNIQDIGMNLSISTTLRNVFRGAETLNIAIRGNVAASKELSNPDDVFFNVTEYGIDAKLNIPRILFPFNTSKIIPKTMLPTTNITIGYSKQENIGLDKQSFLGAFNYNWKPKLNHNYKFELFNIQYIKNVNPQNYFNVYRQSYGALNNLTDDYIPYLSANNALDQNNNLTIENGTNTFIEYILDKNNTDVNAATRREVEDIYQRKRRLTENNLIFSSAINYQFSSKENLLDNQFYNLRLKLETAGNFLSLFAKSNSNENLVVLEESKKILDIEYSQYFKTEIEFTKYFELKQNMVLAFRAFGGVAIPYGNSQSIPFSRSYFAGGSNDIRAWQPYRLGPGSSGAVLNFNEANLKLLFNLEYRYKIFGNLKGALFIDAGNIWNVLDNVNDESYVFTGLKSLESIAVGTGTGLRYDFGLVVLRFDLGIKTYNPVLEKNERWFKNFNLNESVFNIGINYPF